MTSEEIGRARPTLSASSGAASSPRSSTRVIHQGTNEVRPSEGTIILSKTHVRRALWNALPFYVWLTVIALCATQFRSYAEAPNETSPIPRLSLVKPFEGNEWGWFFGNYIGIVGVYEIQGRTFFLLAKSSRIPFIFLDAGSGKGRKIPVKDLLGFENEIERYKLPVSWGPYMPRDALGITLEGSPGNGTFSCILNFGIKFAATDPARFLKKKFYLVQVLRSPKFMRNRTCDSEDRLVETRFRTHLGEVDGGGAVRLRDGTFWILSLGRDAFALRLTRDFECRSTIGGRVLMVPSEAVDPELGRVFNGDDAAFRNKVMESAAKKPECKPGSD